MKFIKSKKGLVLLATLAVAVMASVGAYAYFTSSASGNGSATVGSSTALSIVQTGTTEGLTPDGGAKNVSFDIANAAGNGVQNLGVVTIDSWVVTPLPTKSCAHDDFSVNPGSAAVGNIADGATYSSDSTTEPSIQLNDSGLNQDGCQGASLALTLSAAQGS